MQPLSQILSILSEEEAAEQQIIPEDVKEKGVNSKFLPNMVRENVFKGFLIDLTLIDQRNTFTVVCCPPSHKQRVG